MAVVVTKIDTRLTMIALISIAFAAVEWGGRDVRFGVTILFVAFVAFLAGRRERRRGRVSVVVDFLSSWRFCPVSTAAEPSSACLEDAAQQLLDALDRRQRPQRLREGALSAERTPTHPPTPPRLVPLETRGGIRGCGEPPTRPPAKPADADTSARPYPPER